MVNALHLKVLSLEMKILLHKYSETSKPAHFHMLYKISEVIQDVLYKLSESQTAGQNVFFHGNKIYNGLRPFSLVSEKSLRNN